MLHRQLEQQKGTRKILVDLLYKKGYCLCIPDPKLIKSHYEQIHPNWLQKFFLSKNAFGLSVIPMFMLIFVKNKHLTADESKRLLELIHLLMSQAEFATIDQLFFENNSQPMAWSYYIVNQLIKFSFDDFVSADKNSKRILAMAASVAFLFEKASVLTLTKFCLNTESIGFNVIQKLFYAIAYENLHPNQIIYLSTISQKLIDKTSNFGIETLCFQKQRNEYSFIWSALGTWLQLVFERENTNLIKINHYTQLINTLFEKINNKKLSLMLLENKNKGYVIILRYLFFKQFRHRLFHPDVTEFSIFFKRWCKKIFSPLTFQQIKLIIENLPLLLIKDRALSIRDRRYLMQNFFDYVFEFCKLQPQEIVTLKDLQEQLQERFFPSHKIIKFFKQVSAHCHFFHGSNFRPINREDNSEDENIDLLSSEYARLNVNYSAVSS
ncbi:MAG: hypothetical protein WAL30_05975 [Candidatus Aquirickettsiella sp.]